MSWDQSWVRGISFGSGCFLTLVSVGLKGLVDDDGLGGQDLPGSEDAYLGATFAAGVLCLLVSFKDQLAACCRSSRGSHLPSSVRRRRVPIRQRHHGTAVGQSASAHVSAPAVKLQAVRVQPQPASPPPPPSTTGGGDGRRRAIKLPRSVAMVSDGSMYKATLSGQVIEIDATAVEAAKNDIKRRGCWPFLFRCVKPKGGVAEIMLSKDDDTVSLSGLSTTSMSSASTVSNMSLVQGHNYVAVDPRALKPLKAARRSRIVVVEPSIPGAVMPVQSNVVARHADSSRLSRGPYRSVCPIGCVYHLDLTAANMRAFGHRESLLPDGYSVVADSGKYHFCDSSVSRPMLV